MADENKNPDVRVEPVPLKKPDKSIPIKEDKIEFDKENGLPIAPERLSGENEINEVIPVPEDYEGTYRKKDDGHVYALAVFPDNVRGRDYHARNTKEYWNGTKQEFENQFVKI